MENMNPQLPAQSRPVSDAYSWAEDDHMAQQQQQQQQYQQQYQQWENQEQQQQQQQQQHQQQQQQQQQLPQPLQQQRQNGSPRPLQAPQPIHTQLAEGELQRETTNTQTPNGQSKIEVDEQQLANALLETLQKLTRPQPAAANSNSNSNSNSNNNNINNGYPAGFLPPPPPPPPPSESYFARTPSTLVAPRTPRTPISNRPRYMSTVSSHRGGFNNTPQTYAIQDSVSYAGFSRPHTRTFSEKSFATRSVKRGPPVPNYPGPYRKAEDPPSPPTGYSPGAWPLQQANGKELEDSDSGDGGDGGGGGPPPLDFKNWDDGGHGGPAVADPHAKQMYLSRLATALLNYGAPTHRVQEYMVGAAKCLDMSAKFFYMPDHFLLSFDDDNTTFRGDFKLATGGGTDLGRFDDVHTTYKLVNHGLISVEEGLYRLDMIAAQKPRYSNIFLFVIYGFAAIGIGPFAYKARFIDLPISFGLGSILGVFQLKFVPANPLYNRIFEISTAIFMSFMGRMIGSIKDNAGNHIFCYSAITQSCINLILPGYWITNAGLELMNHQLVAGATRMMHALVYYLFLAFGITIGSALYGFIDYDAVSAATCSNVQDRHWNLLFVPFFSIQVAIISRAKLRQIPAMVLITFASYAATFVTVNVFNGSFTFANTIGGFVIGLTGNLYPRIGPKIENGIAELFRSNNGSHRGGGGGGGVDDNNTIVLYAADAAESAKGDIVEITAPSLVSGPGFALAAAAMVPAMIVQVPSGLSAIGATLTGLTAADAIVRNETSNADVGAPAGEIQTIGMPVILNVVQIGIAIGFGLSVACLILYPSSSRKRSGIMSW